jgi:carboxyl-terminal processing protease
LLRWKEQFTPLDSLDLLRWEQRGEVGLLRLRNFLPSMEPALDSAMDALASTRSLVVDLRGNGGGNLLMAERFRSRFLRRTTTLGVLRRTLPGGALGPDEALVGEPHDTPFAGRVVFVTDPATYSAAEDCLLGLQGLDHVKVAGAPSGGGSGRCRLLRILPDRQLSISTALTWDRRRRCIEGHGIAVDVPVIDTPASPDASLARALQLSAD